MRISSTLIVPTVLTALFLLDASAFGRVVVDLTPNTSTATSIPPTDEGTLIRETVNPYRFQPKDDSVTVDAKSVNLKQLFEDLGPDAIEWYQHVQTLSNPYFEGRCPGSAGHIRAMEYIEWWMTRTGLEPGFAPLSAGATEGIGSYRQPFELAGSEPKVVSSKVVAAGVRLENDKGYVVTGASSTGDVTGPLRLT